MRLLMLALGLCAGGAFVFLAWYGGSEKVWLQAWLVAALFWLGGGLGGLMLLLVRRLTGGAWRPAVPFAALAGTLPLALLAFVPLGFGLAVLLPWAGPGAHGATLGLGRAPWLGVPALLARTGVIFLLWLGIAWWAIRGRMGQGGAVVAILLALVSLMLFLVDWVLGLTPGWSTEVFPMLFALAITLVAPTVLALGPSGGGHGLVPWLCAGALFLLYLLFLQYLVVWTGNLPDQVTWYLARRQAPWSHIGTAGFCLLGAGGAMGFLWSRLLTGKAVWILGWSLLVGEILVVAWMLLPDFQPLDPRVYGLTALAVVSLGGLWGLLFLSLGGLGARREAM
jgi:hypothetical protein